MGRRAGDRGEGALSYIGVILLIASIAAAVTVVVLPETVTSGVKGGLCRVVGQRCDPETPPGAGASPSGSPSTPPSGAPSGTPSAAPSGSPSPGPTGSTAPPPGGTPPIDYDGGDPPADPEVQALQDAFDRAQRDAEGVENEWENFDLLEELKKLGMDFLFGDIQKCIQKPNFVDCLWALVSVVPWGKIGKLLKTIPKLIKLADRFLDLKRRLDRFRGARDRARKNLDDLLRRKSEALGRRVDDALARACGQNSFVLGTQVLMADGTRRAIERIRPGDRVLAGDPVSGRVTPKTVTDAFGGDRYESLVRVVVDIDGDQGARTGAVTATEHHRFWDAGRRAWKRADELAPGSWLRGPAGEGLRVLAAVRVPGRPEVRDLTVAGLHTFFVVAGGGRILVHNETAPSCVALSKLPGPGNRYRSPQGLVYGDGSAEGHRILHVLEHGRENLNKPLHSVFKPDKGVLDYVDEAWSKRHSVTPIQQGNRQVYIIPMDRAVGTQGEKFIRVVVQNGKEVITAFPQLTRSL
ncbi:polymorphic toxin-type HINT domain-containing protein [Actinomadura viridis]|uniref:polymorphic toxin-type HINT domain-containing protein n=1 Tax=Actinomadura viridis TaxID=58110 RepID=UPI003689535B